MKNVFMSFRVAFFWAVLAALAFGSAGDAMAQTIYGSISGTVVDQSGGPFQGLRSS